MIKKFANNVIINNWLKGQKNKGEKTKWQF